MIRLYSVFMIFFELLIRFFYKSHPKLTLLVNGQKNVFNYLNMHFPNNRKTLWVHAASLGEYELCLPLLELFKTNYPNYTILLTFFSPSGYEARKNNSTTKIVSYLPLDTPSNAKRFISIVKPDVTFIIKNEFWPNYLSELYKQKAIVFCISGRFRKNQFIFKPYCKFVRQKLLCFTYFFVINKESSKVLKSAGYFNHSISGDTGIDRTLQLLKQNNNLEFLKKFKGDNLCIIAGSTHIEDEKLILPILNKKANINVKYVIVPHEVYEENIKSWSKKITLNTILYSEIKPQTNLSKYDVIIIDTVGLLTKIYSYADIVYVGGGMRKWDLHNVLEPAIYKLPIIIGPYYQKFYEASNLVANKGVWIVKTHQQLETLVNLWGDNSKLRQSIGEKNHEYIHINQGATKKVFEKIQSLIDTSSL